VVPNSSTILRTYARQLPGAARAAGCGVIDCPIDDLLRDPAVWEVLVLDPHAVLVRTLDGWAEADAPFRDADHLRDVLVQLSLRGTWTAPTAAETVRDVRLANGFRMTAILPPEILGASPTAAFVRG
jgi:type IV secretory pathway ATPase VirB11/archaellum biosynthesis ATPase